MTEGIAVFGGSWEMLLDEEGWEKWRTRETAVLQTKKGIGV